MTIDDPIYTIADAAELLGVSESFLRSQLRRRRFAGYKPAGKWLMRESQIRAAMDLMSTDAEPETASRAGLAPRSRLRRRIHARAAS